MIGYRGKDIGLIVRYFGIEEIGVSYSTTAKLVYHRTSQEQQLIKNIC